ncbi:MAG: NAD(P)H-binding protein [Deltaproteobacteria bacterium]
MTRKRAAIVLGASGSVGNALVAELFHDGSFDPVITLSRRSAPEVVAIASEAKRTVREQIVPEMNAQTLEAATLEALRDVEGEVEGFSVLGVGSGTAKITYEEHRAIDVGLNEAFAKALKASGKVTHLGLMTAAGANPQAKATGSGAAGMSRYSRVKGEAEEAVRANGPAIVSIFRPAMIIGSQHTPWLLEKTLPVFSFLTPAKLRSITVTQIAKAMIAAATDHPAASAVNHYPEMMALVSVKARAPL